jgi:hypothetical protein
MSKSIPPPNLDGSAGYASPARSYLPWFLDCISKSRTYFVIIRITGIAIVKLDVIVQVIVI